MTETTNAAGAGAVHPGMQDDPNDTREPPVTTPPTPEAAEQLAAQDDEEHGELSGTNQPTQSGAKTLGEGLTE